jgi:sulfur relay (sulfurtransferase) DsrF/TusC family protein
VDAVQNPISNIKSLHATVSIANHEFKANFGEKPFVFDILAYQKKNASETDLSLYYETIQSHLCSFMDSESFEGKFFEDQSLFPLASDCNPPKSPVEISHFGYMLTYCRNHPESTVSLSDDFYIQLQTCRAMCHSAKRLLESEPTKSTQRYLQTLATMFEQQNYEEKSWQEKVITIYNLASNHVTNLVGQLLHHTIDSTAQYAFRYESWAIKAICLHQIVFSDTPDGHFINQAAVNLLQHQTQDSELTEEVLLQFLFDMIFSTFQLRAGVMEVVANQRCAEIIKQKSQEYEQLSKIYGEDFLFKTNYSLMFKELEDRAKEERNLTDVEKRLDPIYLLPSFLRRYNTPMGQVAVDFLVLCGVYKYQIAPEQFSTKEEFLEEVKRRICDSITPELLDEYLQYCKDRAKNNPDDKSFEKEVASLPFLGVDLSQGRNIDEIRKVVLKLDKRLKKPMHGTENQTTAGSKFSVRVSVGIMAGLAIGIGLGLFFLRKKVK